MTYQLNFSALWPYWPDLLSGLLITIELTVMATMGGMALGIVGAAIRCSDNKASGSVILRHIWGGYVEIVRNTPFVVQLFFIVFGLPALGLKLSAGQAALLAMLQYRDYPRRNSGQCQRPMGSRASIGVESQPDIFPGDPAAFITADLSCPRQPVHYCDARLCGGIASGI